MTAEGGDDRGGVRCPRCRSEAVVAGGIAPHGESRPMFLPRHCGSSTYTPGVIPSQPLRACLSCGRLWSEVGADALRALIAGSGHELTRQYLDEIDRGPYRDLPATDAAREVADRIAELDAIARTGSPGAIARRYREMCGVSWDQAHHAVREWPRLTREAKLELFGWAPKKKGAADDFDSPFF